MKRSAYSTRSRERFVFVANSHWSAEMAKSSSLVGGVRVEVIHYGLDQYVYSPGRRREAREALGIGADERVLLFAANNLGLPHKGGRYLREALANLRCQQPVRLLTMGAGHFQPVSGYRHSHFGQVESDELQALLYRAADVFVIPSLEEAFGQTALEAVACGTVVAGFAAGGIVDIVQNELNGLLVVRGDSNALGQAIMRLLKDEALRVRWQKASQAWVKARFSFDRNATAYHALYQSLLVG
jgi:glycosyltransferase involved in cell wall biosynthesis